MTITAIRTGGRQTVDSVRHGRSDWRQAMMIIHDLVLQQAAGFSMDSTGLFIVQGRRPGENPVERHEQKERIN